MIARTTLGRVLAVILSAALSQVATPFAFAAENSPPSHVVDPQQVTDRLASVAAEREAQIKLVQDALSTAEAKKQATVMGVPLGRLRAVVPHLSDAELKDLSQRAANVKDVAAGHHHSAAGPIILATVLLVAGLAILVAVSDWDDDEWDDDWDDCWDDC